MTNIKLILSATNWTETFKRIFYSFFFCGATALLGPRPPHCWCFEIIHDRTGCSETSVRNCQYSLRNSPHESSSQGLWKTGSTNTSHSYPRHSVWVVSCTVRPLYPWWKSHLHPLSMNFVEVYNVSERFIACDSVAPAGNRT